MGEESAPARTRRLRERPHGIRAEASLDRLGLPTTVGAVTKMLRPSGDRVKTDRRDADFLARMLAVGNVVECWCPTTSQEADRDLSRLREHVREDLMRARHQLSKFLLRKGHVWQGKTTWTRAHLAWMDKIEFAEAEERFVYGELRAAVTMLDDRKRRIDAEIARRAASDELAPVVASLSGIRGVSVLTAFSVAVECGDLTRLGSARAFMSFVGLVPSEHPGGESTSRGAITKTGNAHVRRLFIEAGWHHERPLPAVSRAQARASDSPASSLEAMCCNCNRRLHKRFLDLRAKRKHGCVIAAAVARELAGFVWAIGSEAQRLAEQGAFGAYLSKSPKMPATMGSPS